MANKLYILCGIPFSGKTTLANKIAEKLGFIKIDLDEVKFELYGREITDGKISPAGWDKIYQEMYGRIHHNLDDGNTVIHDTGNFTRYERGLVKDIADKLEVETIIIFVDTPKEEAYKRLLENRQINTRFNVSDEDFKDTVEEMEPPLEDEKHLILHQNDQIDEWIAKNL
jgi:predicted kinase